MRPSNTTWKDNQPLKDYCSLVVCNFLFPENDIKIETEDDVLHQIPKCHLAFDNVS